ncbi:uncharacterized protein Gasu_03850 [Galdieria sulphuraria]|uniref:Uncharacterized protein n=1 Tax=Galdieria sulphuraria TaxID=130081 RepID=M2XQV1_GALSU|nr:uncharacterized protein Gasu_03850 [Galdieria sulphuraria]EME32617.1 hypothetical protein Gasu_03850 [Galdieria sulphuraria]|eukprot:XP_005709137.1 hypothetical protein Gasu_03850 [Galdieria sulphuraria]
MNFLISFYCLPLTSIVKKYQIRRIVFSQSDDFSAFFCKIHPSLYLNSCLEASARIIQQILTIQIYKVPRRNSQSH